MGVFLESEVIEDDLVPHPGVKRVRQCNVVNHDKDVHARYVSVSE